MTPRWRAGLAVAGAIVVTGAAVALLHAWAGSDQGTGAPQPPVSREVVGRWESDAETGPGVVTAPSPARPALKKGSLARLHTAPVLTTPHEVSLKLAPGVSVGKLASEGRRLGFTVTDRLDSIGWVIVRAKPGVDLGGLAARLRSSGLARVAEPGKPVQLLDTPNDPLYATQWGFENTGQSGGTVGADSKAYSAWNHARGDGVIVAVVDTGVWIDHPEFAGRLWTNPGEIPNNGIDDDGNGKVDDYYGWDFAHNDSTVYDPVDIDRHGTHVAGTIAANTNNGVGGAGMARAARIMPLKFITPATGSDANGAAAITYAVDHGARVVNCSWGGPGISQILIDAINYAAQKGVLLVFAAGNDGKDIDVSPTYPASLNTTNIVSVAALDRSDQIAGFSNRGAVGVDVGAPGVDIVSTQPHVPAALEMTGTAYKCVYLAFPAESITATAARNSVISGSLSRVATSTSAPVLVVDDSWHGITGEAPGARLAKYTSALGDAGYSNVTTWVTQTSGVPTATVLAGKTVVWFTGASFAANQTYLTNGAYTFTLAERNQIAAFLNAGGRLVVSSGDAGFDMWWLYYYGYSGTSLNWYRTYFHANLADDDPGTGAASGLAGGPFPGTSFTVSDPIRATDGFDMVMSRDASAVPVAQWGEYGRLNGTSMAAPHVTGAVALRYSRTPTMTATQARDRLFATVAPVAALATNTVTHGRLDAASFVGTMAPPPLQVGPGGPGALTLYWQNPADGYFDHTRVLARTDTTPTGPLDGAAVLVHDGTAQTATKSGVSAGDTWHFAAYSVNSFGMWTSGSYVTTTVAGFPSPGVPIPPGTNVSVTMQGVTLTFPQVYEPGWLSITRIIPARKSPPANFAWVDDRYYEIHPVGNFATPVDISVPFIPNNAPKPPSRMRFFHDTFAGWSDVTVSIDPSGTVHARTDSFSDFGLGDPLPAGGPVELTAERWWTGPLLALVVGLAIAVSSRRRRRVA